MKKNNTKLIHWILVLISGAILLATSCDDKYRNDWFGKWQLRSIDTGSQSITVDSVYFNFQTDLFMYQILLPSADTTYNYYGVNVIEGDSIHLILENKPGVNNLFWKVSGWKDKEHTYAIKKMESKELILSDENGTYNFRKF